MSVDPERIKRVLEAFEAQQWEEIHLVTADAEVHLTTREELPALSQTSHVSGSAGPVATVGTAMANQPSDAPRSSATTAEPSSRSDLVEVAAPTPGIFWRAPSPGAPPFVDVGSRVEPNAQLCIVEVMKLMNTLPAPVAGTVVEVCAENGEQIDAGRVLFRIRPDGI